MAQVARSQRAEERHANDDSPAARVTAAAVQAVVRCRLPRPIEGALSILTAQIAGIGVRSLASAGGCQVNEGPLNSWRLVIAGHDGGARPACRGRSTPK